MDKALVSILTPCFNSENFIAEAIRSVQNQTYEKWEMIIVDDCSSDQTIAIVTQIALLDCRIQLHQLSQNSGAGITRGIALAKAKGKYIAFLDADDLWKPNKLAVQIDFMKATNSPFTFSFYDCIQEDGQPQHKTIKAPLLLTYRKLFFCNYVGNLTGIYDATYFGKIAISSSRKRQDWMHWLTILKQQRTAQPVPQSLAYYRIRKNSLSASKLDLLKYNFAVYRTFHNYNVFIATLCMIGFLFSQLILKPRFSTKIKASI